MTVVYLLRHAESQPSKDVEEAQWPLSERGRQQALDLVPVLKALEIDAVYSSPFPRAVATAEPFARDAGLQISTHPDLRERKLVDKFRDDWQEILIRAWSDFDFALPGCESSRGAQTRMLSVLKNIAAANTNRRVLAASHGNVIGLALNAADASFGHTEWKQLRNPDLKRLTFDGSRFQWDREFKI